MIEIRGLVKSYDSFRAVDELSLRVERGEIVGLVGPNGAGKTTTLRCLAGIIPATFGQIAIGGRDLVGDPIESRRRLAFVPDEPSLFEYLTVRDHITLFARLYGVADGSRRGLEMLRDNNLDDRLDAFPSELSRGMKQKLIISCALLHCPEALVLDEPLTGLDPAAMRRMKRLITRTAGDGTAVLVSSHMLHLVEEICHRVVILQKGRKILEGTLADIRHSIPELGAEADLEEIFLRATGLEEGEA